MAAQMGKDLLLKVDESGGGSFVTVAGLRTKRISFGAEAVDVTDQSSAGQWRELLDGAGVKRANVSGAGIFKDASSDGTVRAIFFSGTVRDWQIVVPDFGTISGPFQVTALEYGGNYNEEVVYDIALESAGQLAFAAS
ncbi:phage major tail protein, TP901-1 family [Acuticoccus sp. MNP-M23]|uniref:phage major tail protein, TP901-1 family n=1 Tax=Acuticoccus sp. MNP-M23 TaxID=3072793 RepID=UPI002815E049|nr:phage major tail protein, TP901-1 family [Acuticoccus sp. MNP-M23]WMS41696.1 phage major tail protein, TP901-1 family [Acuticoccus sp. MNP-M23]